MKGEIFSLGIFGFVFGVLGAILALGIGGLGSAFGTEGAAEIIRSSLVAILVSAIGFVGACLARSKPRLAGWLMIDAAVVGFVAVFMAYVLSGIFFFSAGVMTLVAGKEGQD